MFTYEVFNIDLPELQFARPPEEKKGLDAILTEQLCYDVFA